MKKSEVITHEIPNEKILRGKDKVAVIVAAAGKGMRMNHSLPKQYLPLEGSPILAHTLTNLSKIPEIDSMTLVVSEDRVQWCKEKIVDRYGIKKVKNIIAGGKTRGDSVWNGLNSLGKNTELVAIHDGVRPFIEMHMFKSVMDKAKQFGAAICAIPLRDTLKKAEEYDVLSTVDRNGLWLVQTPQIFRISLIMEAYKKAKKEHLRATDDAALVEKLPHPVRIVEGSPLNLKITTPQDLFLAEAIYEILYS